VSTPVQVLFVCLGNICRSPTAHGVFARQVEESGLGDRILVESAATAAFHVGNGADPRTVRAAATRGYDLSKHRARQVKPDDFARFDFILPMDRMNLGNLRALQPRDFAGQLDLFMRYNRRNKQYSQVPDPYNDGQDGFELVLDLVEDAAEGLLEHIRQTRL
jgi:protein-tyrosine phosphatase